MVDDLEESSSKIFRYPRILRKFFPVFPKKIPVLTIEDLKPPPPSIPETPPIAEAAEEKLTVEEPVYEPPAHSAIMTEDTADETTEAILEKEPADSSISMAEEKLTNPAEIPEELAEKLRSLSQAFNLKPDAIQLTAEQIRFFQYEVDQKIFEFAKYPEGIKHNISALLACFKDRNIDSAIHDFDALTGKYSSEEARDLTCLLLLLSFNQEYRLTANPESKGKLVDLYLLVLRLTTSSFINPAYAELRRLHSEKYFEFLVDTAKVVSKEKLPGLDTAVREELILQTRQSRALNALGYTKITDVRFSSALPYPEGKDDEIISTLDPSSSPDKILQAIFALTSPFKCSLGRSPVGKQNLEEFNKTLEKAVKLLEYLTENSPQKQDAQWAILLQIFHNSGSEVASLTAKDMPRQMQDRFQKYLEYRKEKPLWSDKLEIYRRYSRTNIPFDESARNMTFRIGSSTGLDAAIAILETGEYLSLHEVFTGNGAKDFSTRAGGEEKLFLLSTGTPDDLYPRYGAVRIMDSSSAFRKVHYGNVTFIFKPEVYERTSATLEDSLSYNKLPFTGKDSLNSAELRNGLYNYIEAQIHGGLTLNDIEAIVYEGGPPEMLTEKCKKLGIKLINKSELTGSYPSIISI